MMQLNKTVGQTVQLALTQHIGYLSATSILRTEMYSTTQAILEIK